MANLQTGIMEVCRRLFWMWGDRMISKKDVQKIYAMGASLGILESGNHDDMLHQLVFGVTGKTSIKELTAAEGYAVQHELQSRLGDKPRRCPRKQQPAEDRPPGMISDAQIKMVWGLAYEIINREELQIKVEELATKSAYDTLGVQINLRAKYPWRMVSVDDGSKLIEALKRRDRYAIANKLRRQKREAKAAAGR